jgi:type IV secretion system protein VirB3
MFLGVPYMPFFIAAGSSILLTFYIDMFCLVLLPLLLLVMRQMARRDEMIFRLLGLRLQLKFKVRNLQQHAGLWVFSPGDLRQRPNDK